LGGLDFDVLSLGDYFLLFGSFEITRRICLMPQQLNLGHHFLLLIQKSLT
jgi:hypothetical protein